MTGAESFKIVLHMERRKDGGLRVWSKHVPGLVLSNRDPEKVLSDIKPALETILSSVFGCEIEARRLGAFAFPRTQPVEEVPHRRSRAAPALDPMSRRKTLEYVALPCS